MRDELGRLERKSINLPGASGVRQAEKVRLWVKEHSLALEKALGLMTLENLNGGDDGDTIYFVRRFAKPGTKTAVTENWYGFRDGLLTGRGVQGAILTRAEREENGTGLNG